MRLLIFVFLLALAACGNVSKKSIFDAFADDYHKDQLTKLGYTDYDLCIQCGEQWTVLPHPEVTSPLQYDFDYFNYLYYGTPYPLPKERRVSAR